MVAAANDRLFAALCEAVGRPELSADPRFATNPLRIEHREALVAALEERLAQEPSSVWAERLEAAGVPAAPVQSAEEAADHEQTRAIGILQQLGAHEALALPVSADGERVLHRSAPPRLGEHTAEVLADAGYAEGEIAELADAGVVRVG